jgi:hypothetical protein
VAANPNLWVSGPQLGKFDKNIEKLLILDSSLVREPRVARHP